MVDALASFCDFLDHSWNAVLSFLKNANQHGFPIPLLASAVGIWWIKYRHDASSEREKLYEEILIELGIWEKALEDLQACFEDPMSLAHEDEIADGEWFQKQMAKTHVAFERIHDKLAAAEIHFAPGSLQAMKDLEGEILGYQRYEVGSISEYIEFGIKHVRKTKEKILSDAKKNLRSKRFAAASLAAK